MTSKHDHAEVAWLAFQYVTDELSAEAATAFENRLADDQHAREALAEAVLLTQALSAAAENPPTVISRRNPWSTALVWAALGAAACLAVVVGGRYLNDDRPVPGPVAEVPVSPDPAKSDFPELDDGQLALAWANAYFPSDYESRLDGVSSLDDDGALAAEVDPAVTVPNWMFEAVRGFEGSSDESSEREDS